MLTLSKISASIHCRPQRTNWSTTSYHFYLSSRSRWKSDWNRLHSIL